MSERFDVIILGRMVGTASGWDGDLGESVWFYEFIPLEHPALAFLAPGELLFDEQAGTISNQDEEGNKVSSRDVVEVLWQIERRPKE